MNEDVTGPFEEGFRVIETLRSDASGPLRLERHLARLAKTCAALSISYLKEDIQALLAQVSGDLRLRLTVDATGRAALEHWPYQGTVGPWRITIAEQRLRSDDPWLGIKTTRRALYDHARATMPDGVDELIFLNERGEICEGTITNIFVHQDGVFLTPPLSCGLLPGVLRQELLDTGRAREAVLMPKDLEGVELYVGNSLRGLIAARF